MADPKPKPEITDPDLNSVSVIDTATNTGSRHRTGRIAR